MTAFVYSRAADEPAAMTTSRGYTLLHWRSGGSEHWVASDLSTGELELFATLLPGADSASAAATR